MTAPCNAAGELTNRTLENGVITGYAYDVAGQLTSMAQTLNNVPFDTLGYTLDNRGRRTGIARAGGKNDGYSYDAIGEVVGGAYAATASGNQTEGFGYDAAGNRLSSAKNGNVTAYTANTLDQYMNVAGETQTYDANGNNTLAQWSVGAPPAPAVSMAMQWDSENRLLTTQSTTAKSENGYDALQRRVWKKVYAPNGSGGWILAKTVVFTYDRWNVIMEKEYGSAGTLARTLRYTWGADVSGNLQGAGGVGGLLMAEEINGAIATPHYYCYDGNGNVTQVVDAAGNLEASHRYTAFGGNLESVTTTAFAQRNPWRFSTKYLDQEVETTEGFYYYGYRFYLTALGRWPSRDPIGERGGVNLYGMVGNDTVGDVDYLGLGLYDELDKGGNAALSKAKEDLKNRQKKYDDTPRKDRVGKNRPMTIFEFCGRVCERCVDGKSEYYNTKPYTSGAETVCDPTKSEPCKEGWKQAGTFHNHPDASGLSGFGPGDDPKKGDKNISERGKKGPSPEYDVPPMTPIGVTRDVFGRPRTDIYDPNIPQSNKVTNPFPYTPHFPNLYEWY